MPTHIVKNVQGEQTEVLLQQYSDRVMVLVTQMGKVGSLTQATIPSTTSLSTTSSSAQDGTSTLPEPPVSIVLTPLMGTSPDAHHQTLTDIYVSQIATLVWSTTQATAVPVVVGVALRRKARAQDDDTEMADGERETFVEVMGIVQEMLSQTQAGL